MTCKEFIDILDAYLEGGLTPEQRAEISEHLHLCPECVDYIDSYRFTIRAVRDCCRGAEDPVPSDVPEKLVQAVLAALKKAPDRRS
ncbi:MAG: hypothetical protein BroJett003_18380 [Planctomycetota bacterium]|nr:MAG: hypothetical protein BroJett003_18380 [Planctomycetota bacterium]